MNKLYNCFVEIQYNWYFYNNYNAHLFSFTICHLFSLLPGRNLSPAILRRFEKRLLLNVPSIAMRKELFKYFFSKHENNYTDDEFHKMAQLTDNFSCSDIKAVCKEVIMITVREKIIKIETNKGTCCVTFTARFKIMHSWLNCVLFYPF